MKPTPRLHTSPLLPPASAGSIPPAAVPTIGGFKSAIPGVTSVASVDLMSLVDTTEPTFPRLVPHYNGNQPHLGMFSAWELHVEGDPSERTIASVMADTPSGEAWMNLFKAAPLLLEHGQYATSVCQDSRRQLSHILSDLSRLPGMDEVIRVINEVEGNLLRCAADLDTTTRQVTRLVEAMRVPKTPVSTPQEAQDLDNWEELAP